MKKNAPLTKSFNMRVMRMLVCSTLLSFAVAGSSAQGQQVPNPGSAEEEVVQLDVFEVKSDGDIGYMSQNAAEVTRMNTAIEDIPMNITVFNQQFIDDLVATDTSEVIAYEASSVKTSENDDFIARGFASVGTNFLNGFAQASGFGSQPMTNIERVEVIRGPAAILYGSGAYGATYNRITKRPKEKPFTMLRTIITDTELYRFEFDNSAPVPLVNSRKFLYRINGVYEDGKTWFKTDKSEKSIAPSLSWQISSRAKLIVEYFYNQRETQANWETPVFGMDPNGIPSLDGVYHSYRDRHFNLVDEEDYRKQTRQFATYDFRLGILRGLSFRSQFQYETKRQRFAETQAKSDSLVRLQDAVLLPRYWREYNEDTTAYRTRNELVWEGRTLWFRHRLLAGFGSVQEETDKMRNRTPWNNGGLNKIKNTDGSPANLQYGDGLLGDAYWTRATNSAGIYNEYPNVTLAQFMADPTLAGFNANNIMPINLFDRSNELPVPQQSQIKAYAELKSNDWASSTDWYANDIVSFARERIFLSGGIRYTEARKRGTNFLSGTFPFRTYNPDATPTWNKAHATIYSGGLVVHLDSGKHFTLYGNLNNSFVPNFNQQPDGSALEPETGKQKEIGMRVSAFGGRLSLLGTYFDIKQNNVTENDPTKPTGSGWKRQIAGVRSQGFEFSANARLTRDWLVLLGYSYTDSRDETPGANFGKARPLVPVNRFTMYNRFNGTQGILKGWTAGCGIIYTGARELTEVRGRGNEVNWGPMDATWRVDASLGYRWKMNKVLKEVELILRVKNLLDNTDMFYVATWNRYTVDAGRECQLILGVRF